MSRAACTALGARLAVSDAATPFRLERLAYLRLGSSSRGPVLVRNQYLARLVPIPAAEGEVRKCRAGGKTGNRPARAGDAKNAMACVPWASRGRETAISKLARSIIPASQLDETRLIQISSVALGGMSGGVVCDPHRLRCSAWLRAAFPPATSASRSPTQFPARSCAPSPMPSALIQQTGSAGAEARWSEVSDLSSSRVRGR